MGKCFGKLRQRDQRSCSREVSRPTLLCSFSRGLCHKDVVAPVKLFNLRSGYYRYFNSSIDEHVPENALHGNVDDLLEMSDAHAVGSCFESKISSPSTKALRDLEALLVQDIFAGNELAENYYDGRSGHAALADSDGVFERSFTCIVQVVPDFSMGEGVELPILVCATPPFERNRILHLVLRGRRPELGFGFNNLRSEDELPEDTNSWLTFLYDSEQGRRIFINGRMVSCDRVCENFCGSGSVEVGKWSFELAQKKPTGFRGTLRGLQCFNRALQNDEIRSLLRYQGLEISMIGGIRLRLHDVTCMIGCRLEDVKNWLGQGTLHKLDMLRKRVTRFADISTDALVVLDAFSSSKVSWSFCGNSVSILRESKDAWRAWFGLVFIIMPFFIEYVLMWRHGIIALERRGMPHPTILYALLGLPAMVIMKLWLLVAKPFSAAGYTSVSFLGAFDQVDFIVEAVAEAPWQTLLNVITFVRNALSRGLSASEFPYLLVISIVTSQLTLYESYRLVKHRQLQENQLNPAKKLSLYEAAELILQAGLGTRYSEFQTPLGEKGAAEELLWVLSPPSILEELIVAGCHLKELGPIGEALKINTTLVELSLSGNSIEDVTPIAEALKLNKTLKVLGLKYNKIHDIGVLLDALKVNESLAILRIEFNSLSDDSKNALKAVCDGKIELSV